MTTKQTKQAVQNNPIARRLGFAYELVIYNRTDKDAWVLLAPHKICTFESCGIDKIGSIGLNVIFTPQTQKKLIPKGTSWTAELDTNDVYYSVFYDWGNKVYKSNAQEILHNARKSDINLLPRHANSARTTEFKP
jgi:hypothetical protein